MTHTYIYIYYIYETSTCFGILHLVGPLAVEATSKSSVTAEAGVEAWGTIKWTPPYYLDLVPFYGFALIPFYRYMEVSYIKGIISKWYLDLL